MEKQFPLFKKPEQEPIKPILHSNILDILFENRKFIKNLFQVINGLHEINYFSLNIIDPQNKLIIFSTTPSIEYNLIHQNLWFEDPIFSINFSKENEFIWWDNAPIKIKRIRLVDNKYSQGITIKRRINNFFIFYSFATKSTDKEINKYYEYNLNSLIDIGDYCYKLTRDLYLQYCEVYVPPNLESLIDKIYQTKSQRHLKLIINKGHL